ncbi:MAG: phycocyanin subunit alpha [Chamaesiphon sp. CSU_1_12]|nr:phycocyanin subunit alpha [Chamaesiphon sp. CSU_1_12]
MKTQLTEAVISADSQGRYLGNVELQVAFGRLRLAAADLEAAKALGAKANQLTEGAANAVYQAFPYTKTMQGNNYASTSRGQAKCLRDIGYYVRILQYCLIAGGTGPADDYLLSGLAEMHSNFELVPSWYAEALKYIKANHGLSGDQALELNSYIDYMINGL